MKIYGIPSTDEMQLTLILTLKMTTHRLSKRQSLSTTVLFNNHPDDHIPLTYDMTSGFEPFTLLKTIHVDRDLYR